MNKRQAIYYGARLVKVREDIGAVRYRADSEALRVRCDKARLGIDDLVEYLESVARGGKG